MAEIWRTVRVFVSSTFRDMQAERDHLVRVVFPELKERCRKRHVQLIDVDLRCGVTEEEAEGGVKPEASEVTFYAIDGYSETLSLEEAQQEGVLLAYAVNGQTLPTEHGYPLRLVVKGKYGAYWVKWMERIEFM